MTNNPFEKQLKIMREESPFNDLGAKSDKPDTFNEDMKKIQDIIPQQANSELDEGFKKMMNILEKTAPKMPKQTTKEQEKVTTNSVFEKAVTTEPQTVVKVEEKKEKKKKAEKNKTKSDELELHYTDEEIMPLIDSLLTKGYASETTTLRGYNITFRTSYLWEDQEVVARTDEKIAGLTLNASGTFFYDIYALAANLEQFGANYFKPVNKGTPAELKKSLDERVDFLEGLSSPFINILMRKKIEFLKKVQFLLDNYDRLLQAF